MKTYHLPMPREIPLRGRVPSQKAICGQALDYKVHTIGLISSQLKNSGQSCKKCEERLPLIDLSGIEL